MYSFIGLIIISGAFLAFQGRWWGRAWIWTALAVLLGVVALAQLLGLMILKPFLEGGLTRRWQGSDEGP